MVGSASAGNDFDYCLLCHGANANGNYGIRAPKTIRHGALVSRASAREFRDAVRAARRPRTRRATRWDRWAGALKTEGTLEAAVKFIGTLESTTARAHDHGRRGARQEAVCRAARAVTAPRAKATPALQSPALAARSDWYLVTQLANYQKGLRGADARDTYGAQMRAIVSTLPDEKAITDVVAYINTLK